MLSLSILTHLYICSNPSGYLQQIVPKREGFEGLSSMSNEEDEEEKRLYRCARTYNKIVGQFDELMEIMNTKTKPPKRRKNSTNGSAAATQHEHNEVIVQTVTRFLHELRTDSLDAECSSTTKGRN